MHSILEGILHKKQLELAKLKIDIAQYPKSDLSKVYRGSLRRKSQKSFSEQLLRPGLQVIAEIKRESPSKGKLAEIPAAAELAETYANAGAAAISVLTDQAFSGTLRDLDGAVKRLHASDVAVLRKDFILDASQIAEAAVTGADAVLLIVAVLQSRVEEMIQVARKMNIEALVEVHTERELEIALDCGAHIIGVNNRNLTTFEVDPQNALRLKQKIPNHCISVAESGVTGLERAQVYADAGFDAVLVGETLVKSDNPGELIQQMQGLHNDGLD